MKEIKKPKDKIFALASRKGGVGKTPIALSLAIDLEYYFLTNDRGIATEVYSNSRYIDKPIPVQNSIYDFGGYASAGVIEVVKQSDLLIIPVINESDAFVKTILTAHELKPYAKETILIATRTEKNDMDEITKEMRERLPNIKIFELSKSKIFKRVTKDGMSILQIANETSLNRYVYRKILAEYTELLNYIKGA